MKRLLFLAAIWVAVLISILREDTVKIDTLAFVAVILLSHLALAFLVRERRAYLQRIDEWFVENPNRIDQHLRRHPDSPFECAVNTKTKCHRFVAVSSLALFTFEIRLFAIGKMVYFTAAIATIWTLMFGWWALPLGPFQTIRAIWKNLRGGEIEYLGDFERWGEYWLVDLDSTVKERDK